MGENDIPGTGGRSPGEPTGKALPFLAMGGSSTLANWLLVALLVKLSDAAGRITHEERNQQPLAAASDEPTAMVPRHAG